VLISDVSQVDLVLALAETNKEFEGNVIFNRLECQNAKQTRYRVTLRVRSSRGKGARLGFPDYRTGKQRHLVNACWHVHGTFFEKLLDIEPEAIIRTNGRVIDRYGGNWEDWNIGSIMYPMWYSEACECE